jgi:hypothetical protein
MKKLAAAEADKLLHDIRAPIETAIGNNHPLIIISYVLY